MEDSLKNDDDGDNVMIMCCSRMINERKASIDAVCVCAAHLEINNNFLLETINSKKFT